MVVPRCESVLRDRSQSNVPKIHYTITLEICVILDAACNNNPTLPDRRTNCASSGTGNNNSWACCIPGCDCHPRIASGLSPTAIVAVEAKHIRIISRATQATLQQSWDMVSGGFGSRICISNKISKAAEECRSI
ncbi:Protein of unknown function [Pyronema omphalodes CBS 100304]|uniref:Uncharacterized protein n=1 Tax=Pyronema omphalodes (strain CBS 100304) TaxID=1076935 RepID=U4KVG4_PYROM|nr:Protein of unknown function [Pyronema omphalodes CBS 100304]